MTVCQAVWWLLWFQHGIDYGLVILFRDHLILYDALSIFIVIGLGALAIVATGPRMTFRPIGFSSLVLLLNITNIISIFLSPVVFESPLRIYVTVCATFILSMGVIVLAQEDRGSTLLHDMGRAYVLGMTGTVLAPLLMVSPAELFAGRYGVEGLISPNQIGFGAALALLFTTGGTGRGRWAVVNWGLAILFTTTLIFTFSKTALVAVAISLGLMWALSGKGEQFAVRCARIAVVLVPLAVLWNRLSGEAVTYVHTAGAALTLSGRTLLWGAVLELSAERPWLGYGFGTSREVLRPFSVTWDTDITHAHNAYLTALLQTGVVGAVLMVLIALRIVGLAFHLIPFRRQPAVRLWIALASLFLIHSITEGAVGAGGFGLALFVALGVIGSSLAVEARREAGETNERGVRLVPVVSPGGSSE